MLLRRLAQVDKSTSRLSAGLISRALSTKGSEGDGDAMAKFLKKAGSQGKQTIWSTLIHEVKDRKRRSDAAIAPSIGSTQEGAGDATAAALSRHRDRRRSKFNFSRENGEGKPERKHFGDKFRSEKEGGRSFRRERRDGERDDEKKPFSSRSDGSDLMTPAEKRHGALVDPTIRPFLFDLDHFESVAMKGKTICTDRMDPLDALVSDSFIESFKAESGETITRVESNRSTRWNVPQPRSLSQLLAASTPDIHAAPGSEEYAMARKAWVAIERNVFYNSHEQQRMVDSVATFQSQFAKWCAEVSDDDLDIICDPRFRPLAYQAACEAESERLAKDKEKREVGEDEYIFSGDASIRDDLDTVVDEDEL